MPEYVTTAESDADTRFIRFDLDPPSTESSAFDARYRGTRSSMRAATSRSVASDQRSNTAPVRSAPLIAVPGRYGPPVSVANVGMKRFSACARSQYGIADGCSNGIR